MKTAKFDKDTLKIAYFRYKAVLVPTLIFCLSVLLLIFVILPQLQTLVTQRDEGTALGERIDLLQKNYTFLSSLSEPELDKQLQIATSTLPTEKDFPGIVAAITASAVNSGVTLGDFSFAVGELSSKSATFSVVPTLQMTLSLVGGAENVKRFVHALGGTLPLSQVTSVQLNNNNASVIVSFFYKPLPPLVFAGDVPISPLSSEDLALLTRMGTIRDAMQSVSLPSPVSSTTSATEKF